MRALFGMITALLLLAGCATSPAEKQAMIELTEKTKLNMIDAMCNQPNYLKCIRQTNEQCTASMKPHQQACIQKGLNVAAAPSSRYEYNLFMTTNVECLIEKNVPFESDVSREGVGYCLQSNPLDKDLFMKNLMGKS